MKTVNRITAEILESFSLINDLDFPGDPMYDLADRLHQFDGHTAQSWQQTEQYKQWLANPDKMLETFRNCSSFMIQLIENSKT
jgi:hypothetical protein